MTGGELKSNRRTNSEGVFVFRAAIVQRVVVLYLVLLAWLLCFAFMAAGYRLSVWQVLLIAGAPLHPAILVGLRRSARVEATSVGLRVLTKRLELIGPQRILYPFDSHEDVIPYHEITRIVQQRDGLVIRYSGGDYGYVKIPLGMRNSEGRGFGEFLRERFSSELPREASPIIEIQLDSSEYRCLRGNAVVSVMALCWPILAATWLVAGGNEYRMQFPLIAVFFGVTWVTILSFWIVLSTLRLVTGDGYFHLKSPFWRDKIVRYDDIRGKKQGCCFVRIDTDKSGTVWVPVGLNNGEGSFLDHLERQLRVRRALG